jgi:ABC-type sugar transport system substrate-binding protein
VIRGALDAFDAPADAGITSRVAQLDAGVVVAQVMEALLEARPDPVAVFAALAAMAGRDRGCVPGEQA